MIPELTAHPWDLSWLDPDQLSCLGRLFKEIKSVEAIRVSEASIVVMIFILEIIIFVVDEFISSGKRKPNYNKKNVFSLFPVLRGWGVGEVRRLKSMSKMNLCVLCFFTCTICII